jgi:hypothetical protein
MWSGHFVSEEISEGHGAQGNIRTSVDTRHALSPISNLPIRSLWLCMSYDI